jgi:sulfatase maturation enzyme AslB (radical SAM superfamily)
MDLKKIITKKSYKTFASSEWPSYEEIVAGRMSDDPKINQEIIKFFNMQDEYYRAITLDRNIEANENKKRQNQIFFDKKYSGSTCRVPWETMGINFNGNIFICQSPSWIPKFIGSINECDDIFNILNNDLARSIRQEILSGRYLYCNNRICGYFSKLDPSIYQSAPKDNIDLTPEPIDYSLPTSINKIPKNLIFDFDYTCNFQCPSCRTEVINWNHDEIRKPIIDQTVKKIKHLIIDQITNEDVTIRWAGGEPLISSAYLEIFEYIANSKKYNIKSIIQTNGSYFNKKKDLITKLLPYLKEIRISFDAASAETYHKIRVNGVWNNLIENVKFLQSLIAHTNSHTRLSADFVVQIDNYLEIPKFFDLCKSLNIESINLQKMWNWGTWPDDEFNKKNIYDHQHPQFNDLKKIFQIVKQKA